MQFELQILNKCQRRNYNDYTHIIRVQQHGGTTVDTLRRRGDGWIEDGCHLPEVHMQCQLVHKIATRFQWWPQHFRDPAAQWNLCEYYPTSGWLVDQRWPPLTGSAYAIRYVSARVSIINENSSASSMFPEYSNTVWIVNSLDKLKRRHDKQNKDDGHKPEIHRK